LFPRDTFAARVPLILRGSQNKFVTSLATGIGKGSKVWGSIPDILHYYQSFNVMNLLGVFPTVG
jgi:hypothetical protein